MRWLLLAVAACSASGKPEREPAAALPGDDRALELPRAGGGPAEPAPPAIAAGEGVPDPELVPGARLHALAGATSGRFAITADSRWVVYADDRGLHSVRVDGLIDRLIAPGAVPSFQLTADGRHVVLGKRLARVPIEGGDELRIAPKLEVAELGTFAISPDASWVAFTDVSGDLAIASLADGAARRLKLPRPRDPRYHFGSAFVKAWSGDSKHLVFQRGAAYEVIRYDGRGHRPLAPHAQGGEAIAHGLAIAIGESSFRVIPIAGGAPFTIATPPLFGFSGPVVAPDARGFAFLAVDYSLHHVDLATRKVRRISASGVRASPFVAHTPDSRHLLYVDMGPEGQRSCTVHAFDLAASRDRVLAGPWAGEQCLVKPAGDRRAVIDDWRRSGDGLRRDFLLVELAGGPVRRLVPTLDGAGNFATSPDGRFLVFDGPRDARPLSLIRLP